MKSVYEIAQQILDDWPYAGQIRSAHKTLLVAMIAEKLSEQRQEGYAAGHLAGQSGLTGKYQNDARNERC